MDISEIIGIAVLVIVVVGGIKGTPGVLGDIASLLWKIIKPLIIPAIVILFILVGSGLI